jgi:hypothetical protein
MSLAQIGESPLLLPLWECPWMSPVISYILLSWRYLQLPPSPPLSWWKWLLLFRVLERKLPRKWLKKIAATVHEHKPSNQRLLGKLYYAPLCYK